MLNQPARPAGGLLPAVSVILLLSVIQPAAAGTDRWYSPNQVERGQAVFTQNCAECHGANAEATPNWRELNPEGKYPPPPLDGTAHAWHHPIDILRRTIRQGGIALGGTMPPFEEKLSAEEIDAAIAFFQSKWPAETYTAWLDRNGEATPMRTAATQAHPATTSLKRLLPDAPVGEPEPTPLAGILRIKVGSGYVYVTQDGRYGFVGDLLDLQSGQNLTENERNRDRLALIAAFPEKDRVLFPAAGEEKARLTVFTDTTCPYCRKLHREVPALQRAGVAVAYIPFPRGGTQGQGYQDMRAVWCASDRLHALDIAKGIVPGELGPSDCAEAIVVDSGYRLGEEVGIQGTPAIVFPNGSLQPGYLPSSGLLARLGLRNPNGARLSANRSNP